MTLPPRSTGRERTVSVMSDADSPLPREADRNMLDWLLSEFVEPEIARRAQAGHPPAVGTRFLAIQVVFNVGREPEVRINEEVRSLVTAEAARAIRQGQSVTLDDVARVERVELTEEDPNAAHVTALYLGDSWHISWDGRYNADIIASHLAAAREFVELAEIAVDRRRLRAFAEIAFEAAELLAKAAVLTQPDERLLATKKHATVAAHFNQWARQGNVDRRYALLLNALSELRASARYLRGGFRLDAERAAEMLVTLQAMEQDLVATSPQRESAT